MNPNIFRSEKLRLEALAVDSGQSNMRRIFALTQLYFLHQFDVHSQARYVRQIETLSSEAK